MLMTVSAYAKIRGVARNAVAYQIERGVILCRPDGLIDTDLAWIPEMNGTASNPEAERRKRQADFATQLVKFSLTRVQLDRMQPRASWRKAAHFPGLVYRRDKHTLAH